MKPKARFIKSVTDTAEKTTINMPWQRGPRRAGFIAMRRAGDTPARRLRTA